MQGISRYQYYHSGYYPMSKEIETAVFIDGYNLYYGRLKGTEYKWLNLHALAARIVRDQAPESRISTCRYYTAMVKSRVASHGDASVQSQTVYHRALESPYTPHVDVICNHHILVKRPMMRYVTGSKPDKSDRVSVWHLEEKQTDVKIALDAYRMAVSGAVQQIVLMTNDTDLEPLLEAIASAAPNVVVGAIIPRQPHSARPAAQAFIDHCHWTRRHILDEELAACQFGDRVPTAKRPVIRPSYW
ncbi:MAG: NYN domain-containing protein [Gammaproteobacteria bacterium]|nr:NYN domain-containing protein [Gammaproteobacteria bacterium]